MTARRQDALFAQAQTNIQLLWESKDGLQQFVLKATHELFWLRGEYMRQSATETSTLVEQRLQDAAQNLQLNISTELEYTRFPKFMGMCLRVSHQGILHAEIYFGPTDAWDKIICVCPPQGYWETDNPYVKKRIKLWRDITQFDFNGVMSTIKARIDNPPPEEPDDDWDDTPF